MTLREVLGSAQTDVRRRLEQVLDSEDAIILLIDRHGTTTYAHGFAVSGCQLEMVGNAIESLLREVKTSVPLAQCVGPADALDTGEVPVTDDTASPFVA